MASYALRKQTLFLGCLAICVALLIVTTGTDIRFDGHTFLVTGERALNGRWAELYEPTGAGPWTYMPPAALFFIPFAVLPSWCFIVSIACAFFLAVYVLGAVLSVSSARCLAAAGCFWFVLWESVFIGQVDTLLLLNLSLAVLAWKKERPSWGGVAIALACFFKPQFAIFALPFLSPRDWRPFVHRFVLTALVCLTLYTGASGVSLSVARSQFASYSERAASIVETAKDVTNQSLRGVLFRLLTDEVFKTRYSPEWFASADMKVSIAKWEPARVADLCSVVFVVVLALVFVSEGMARRSARNGIATFALLAAALPTLSPVFWQVHAIYLVVPALYLLARFSLLSITERAVLVLAFFSIAASSPLIVTRYYADLMMAYGALYIASLGLFAIMLSEILRVPTEEART